jgi:hypothetical protein
MADPTGKSNQILVVTCAEYNKYRFDNEMLTYKHLTNNAVQETVQKIFNKEAKVKKIKRLYTQGYLYRVNVQGYRLVMVYRLCNDLSKSNVNSAN